MKINGKWYFNETPTMIDHEPDQMINVTIKGVQYDGIDFEILDLSLGAFAIWAGNDADEILGTWDEYSNGWESEAHRTWDFGAAYQEVSDEFYSWLTANAVQLSKPIPMTHPKGIKLLTKGHKLSKDLEVVPTFMDTVDITINADQPSIGAFTVLEDGKISTLYIDDVIDFTGTTLKVIKNSFFYINNYAETTLSDGEFLGETFGVGIYKATANATLTITH